MQVNAIRRQFLDFFSRRDHEVVPSSPLVPANDPTLLFTNAGMVQFKDVFLGQDERPYSRAVTAQRCLRAGGKHNDLENVGYTARHHTFFEMLGNFSFGDYFKREAIEYAWAFLTEVAKLPSERLWVTVFEDDEEAAALWLKHIGVNKDRFARIGAKDNFWAMGDTGPCGPCSEIFYDHGPEVPGGPPGSSDEGGDRFVEVWNLVFMQFDRNDEGEMTNLPKPCVDTGLGLERLAAVLQGVHSNYEIDLFQHLIAAAARATGTTERDSPSLNVISDHIRACAFLIADGVAPANEGRGYVLRRIIRRAVRHGHKLGAGEPFFYQLVAPLAAQMGDAYPILNTQKKSIEKQLHEEEVRFNETLDQGMKLLDAAIAELSGNTIDGGTVFKLYDTYGFPVDLTADIARERELELDLAGFENAMEQQRARGRAASGFRADSAERIRIDETTAFSGYEDLEQEARIVGLFKDGDSIPSISAGDEAVIVLDSTPFYAEAGGQIGDHGRIQSGDALFEVADCRKRGQAYLHHGRVQSGAFEAGMSVHAAVDRERRQATVLNHSATHLLHAALREVLGEHVTQKGSLVAPDRLRFDFSHQSPLNDDALRAVEARVNEEIRKNFAAEISHMSYDEAMDFGAMALFGEKYGDSVRVLKFGDFSTELCGGTHVQRTGDIGFFKIVAESGIASGVRRIEAVTGRGAERWVAQEERRLGELAALLKTDRASLVTRTEQLFERQRRQEQEIKALRAQLSRGEGGDLSQRAVDIQGVKVVAERLDGADAKTLRDTVDRLKNQLKSAAVVLAAADDGKVRLVAGVTKDRMERLPAGELVNMVAEHVGGRGGGRADMAQAGGSEPGNLDKALAAVSGWVQSRLS